MECLLSLLLLCQVAHIKDYLPKACPHGDSVILDSEVLVCVCVCGVVCVVCGVCGLVWCVLLLSTTMFVSACACKHVMCDCGI